MGNSQTNIKKQNKKSVTVSHPAFETAQIIRNTLGKQVIQIRVSVKSQKEYQQWVKSYKRIPRTNSMLFPQQSTFSNSGCCGSSGIAQVQIYHYTLKQITYPLFPYTLNQQLQNRRQNNKSHFKQQQIWLLLFNLVQAVQMFHLRKLKLGDIRTQNVFMNSTGEIKVLSQLSYPYGVTNYTYTVVNNQYCTYLAPEQVKDIQFGKIKDLNDPLIVESFSIGLTVLDAALLASSEKFYQNAGMFGYEQLNESLRLLAHVGYSSQLTGVITKMCDPQPNSRLKANQVLKYLKPYTNEILSKKSFNVKSLPWGQQAVINNNQSNGGNRQNITINTNNNVNNNTNNNQQTQLTPNNKTQQFKFIPGVVFDSRDQGLLQSSLKHGKQVVIQTSRVANTYQIPQKDQITDFNCPVQTSIYYPPITIQLPPPIQHNINHNRGVN